MLTKNHNEILVTVQPRLVGAEIAAHLLGISTKLFWRLDREGRVPMPIRFGTRKLWSIKSLDEWVSIGCPLRK